jgi:dTDP-4-dehydrorhamnose 3,5-epimerase
MHWQAAPHGEGKLVRCTRGAIVDVAVDLRPDSPTHLEHVIVQLDEENRRALFIPPGAAHGFLTLADRTEVLYQMDTAYVPDAARGARWDDPSFAIAWPASPAVMSERDRSYPDYIPEPASVRSASWT